ncbi:transporter, partial [Aspergillus sclerotialis]
MGRILRLARGEHPSTTKDDNAIEYADADAVENKPTEMSDPSALEEEKKIAASTQPVHSAFSKHEKRFIVFMVTMASFFSPLSGQIYYPIMPTLVQNYHLSNALVNLTISTYMILQGLAPSFMGTFADTGGRRPAYILAFAIYTAANIGLALQDSYAALMILRCIQSAGSSGTVSFGYGVIADIATPAERGMYIGPMAAGVMIAPAVGPVFGGLLARYLGWRSVFWFLVIISGGYLGLFIVAMPETARKIVGNGSVPPKEWWRMSLAQFVLSRRRLQRMSTEEQKTHETERARLRTELRKTKISFPNPLKSFAILLEKDALIIISYVGLVMFANIALLTTTPNLFGSLYDFNDFQIGLCFIPLGVSACIAAVLNGKVIDNNYARTARKLGFPVDRRKGDDLRHFPIEKSRLQTVFPGMALGIAAFIPYGWVLERRAPLVAPLILQFVISFCFIASLNTLNTLLIDLFPDRPATAAAACNLVRCWLGAVGAAVIDHMLSGMGWG